MLYLVTEGSTGKRYIIAADSEEETYRKFARIVYGFVPDDLGNVDIRIERAPPEDVLEVIKFFGGTPAQ